MLDGTFFPVGHEPQKLTHDDEESGGGGGNREISEEKARWLWCGHFAIAIALSK